MPLNRLDHVLAYSRDRLKAQLEQRRTCVYVLGCDGFVKIGIAHNPRRRIAELQTGSPHKIEFLGMFYTLDAKLDEKRLHTEFDEFRQIGEWFLLDEYKLAKLLGRACYALE